MTIEQVLQKQHKIVRELCDNVEKDIRKTIEGFCNVAPEIEASAVDHIRTRFTEIVDIDPDMFNDDTQLQAAVTNIMDLKKIFEEFLLI
jgi:hypothetical protein